MKKNLPLSDLTENEANIRQLLLDTSDHIGTSKDAKPLLRFAGGWVRDKLLGSASDDIDVAIDNMTGYDFGLAMKAFVSIPEVEAKYTSLKKGKDIVGNLALIAANPDKSKHLATATVKIFDLDVDFVNLRRETYVADSRTPQMEFGTAEEDALRRDSTINALFYNIHTSEVEDFTGRGLVDMERKIIKTPLPPLQTFRDDPLRVLRHIRFASRLGFRIDLEDEQAMSDPSIKEEFKLRITRETNGPGVEKKVKGQSNKGATELKISRERVGVEVDKMLKGWWTYAAGGYLFANRLPGPDPHMALRLIDQFGLYNTIFTDADVDAFALAETTYWHRAYDQLLNIVAAQAPPTDNANRLSILKTFLLRDFVEEYRAWLLCALVPWARVPVAKPEKSGAKTPPSLACLAVREGIKADNKISKIVEDAVHNLEDIIEKKDEGIESLQSSNLPQKRKFDMVDMESRVKQGKAIRLWGSHWRSSVLYALLVQIWECEESSKSSVCLITLP